MPGKRPESVAMYSTRPKRGPIEAPFIISTKHLASLYSTRPKRGPIEAHRLLFDAHYEDSCIPRVLSVAPLKRDAVRTITIDELRIPRVLSVAPLKLLDLG